jgi:hypothetical protein
MSEEVKPETLSTCPLDIRARLIKGERPTAGLDLTANNLP